MRGIDFIMLKQRTEQIQALVRLTDALVCIFAYFVAYWIRFPDDFATHGIEAAGAHTWMLAASLTLHLILYPRMGFYESLRLKTIPKLVGMVFRAGIVEFFILGSLVFFLQAKTTSRYFFGSFLLINYGLVLIEKISARVIMSSIRRRGYNFRQVLVVGAGKNALQIIGAFIRNKQWGYVPFGVLRTSPREAGITEHGGVKVMGDRSEIESIVKTRAVDEVYFAPDELNTAEMNADMRLCEKLGIPARVSLGFFDLTDSRITINEMDGIPVLTYYTTLKTPFEAFLKRVMDILISLAGLLVTVALYPWISSRIQKESPGPIIFKQVRIGENGRRFKCYKFRTMHLDAESRKQELLAANKMEGPIFKIDNDPRTFPFGAFLRRTSLDELPQFFNILRGDMGVVGTRPPTPDEVEQYQMHFRRRLSIRPGLTGLWQVSGRNQIHKFDDILELDLRYIDQWSLWLDIKIILKTIWVIFSRKGAY